MRYMPFAIFVAFALLVGSMLLQMNAPKNPTTTDKPFPVITVQTLDGNTTWNPDALKGHVTVINFFASWCQPCAMEMPELRALKKQFPAIHLEGVAWNDAPLTLKNFLLNYRNPFEQVWLDKQGSATIALGIRGIPETFIVDGNGIVRYQLEGELTPDTRNGEIGALITKLLAEQAHAK